MTLEKIAEKYNVSELTIKRDFKKLQNLKLNERKGSKKIGYWKIIKWKKNKSY